MNQYRAVDGDRLDIIAFKAYGSISAGAMEALMDANEHLLESTTLVAGDVVNLPEIESAQPEAETKALW